MLFSSSHVSLLSPHLSHLLSHLSHSWPDPPVPLPHISILPKKIFPFLIPSKKKLCPLLVLSFIPKFLESMNMWPRKIFCEQFGGCWHKSSLKVCWNSSLKLPDYWLLLIWWLLFSLVCVFVKYHFIVVKYTKGLFWLSWVNCLLWILRFVLFFMY